MRLREPADVLCAIPYLLGYHPSESAVVIGLRGKQLHLTLRLDLPEPQANDIAQSAEAFRQAMAHNRVDGVVLVGYGADERVRPLLRALRRACERGHIRVAESLRAFEGRYWSYLCRNPRCCSPAGTPYDTTTGVVAAQAIVAGQTALPDFAAYAAQLESAPWTDEADAAADRAVARMVALTSEATSKRDAEKRLIAAGEPALAGAIEQVRRGMTLSDDEVAWLAILTISILVRDVFWSKISGRHERKRLHRDLWLQVMRRCDETLRPGVGSLFAFASWQCGDSKLAALALERVLAVDPDYSMAHLLEQALARGVPPTAMGNPPDPRSLTRLRRRPRRPRSPGRRANTRSSTNPSENPPA
jgi:hypothetical protein